ncbi:hypothetical protein [Streptomyces sp. I05A-00742]|uniref:hypothetical protein n=1 Tax=Streptomyces sp. I05A-00742 TaxID=2732853 RepID=UPI0014890A94|nr:hypothetical protein [Streptomyces sp. I05A-00742]
MSPHPHLPHGRTAGLLDEADDHWAVQPAIASVLSAPAVLCNGFGTPLDGGEPTLRGLFVTGFVLLVLAWGLPRRESMAFPRTVLSVTGTVAMLMPVLVIVVLLALMAFA